jgi:hypothetical protein
MSLPGRRAGAATCLAAFLALLLAATNDADAGLGSIYADCWFSKKTGKLIVKTEGDEEATLRRRGKRLAVLAPKPTVCKGGRATIRNTERVRFVLRGSGITEGHVSLSGGPFGPGASPETDSTPEIEFHVVVPDADSTFFLDGTPGGDELRAGTSAGIPGVNLNPAAEQSAPDVDITLGGRAGHLIWFAPKGGDDFLDLTGGPEFQGPPGIAAVAELGAGNDRFTGSPLFDFVFGDAGLDAISTGGSDDWVNSQDGLSEPIDCGAGMDRIQPDASDILISCEEIGFVGFAD